MSKEQRTNGEALRAKYARVFGCPVDVVKLAFTENGDAFVFHAFLKGAEWPVWSTGDKETQVSSEGRKP